jgi:hypothetical protein
MRGSLSKPRPPRHSPPVPPGGACLASAVAHKNRRPGGTPRRRLVMRMSLSADENRETKNIPHSNANLRRGSRPAPERREPNKMRRPGLEVTGRRKDHHLSPEGWRETTVYQDEPPQTGRQPDPNSILVAVAHGPKTPPEASGLGRRYEPRRGPGRGAAEARTPRTDAQPQRSHTRCATPGNSRSGEPCAQEQPSPLPRYWATAHSQHGRPSGREPEKARTEAGFFCGRQQAERPGPQRTSRGPAFSPASHETFCTPRRYTRDARPAILAIQLGRYAGPS